MMTWNLLGNMLETPNSQFNAALANLVAQTGNSALMPGSPGISAGYLYVCQAYVDQSVAAGNAYINQLSAGTSCANSFIGVYDPSTLLLLAQTADISSALNATQTAPIKSALTGAGLPAQPLNKELWLVLLIGSTSSTPTVVGRNNTGSNIGQTSDYRFQMSAVNGYTSLPGTMPSISPASASQSQPFLAIGP